MRTIIKISQIDFELPEKVEEEIMVQNEKIRLVTYRFFRNKHKEVIGDLVYLIERICSENDNRDFVYAFGYGDLSSLIAAIINCQLNRISEDNLWAFVNTINKYSTRKILGGVNYKLMHIDEITDLNSNDNVYLKAPFSVLGHLGFNIEDNLSLRYIHEIIKENLPKLNKNIKLLSKEYFPDHPDNIALGQYMLVEEKISAPQFTVEGYVDSDGGVQVLFVTDTDFFTEHRMIDKFITPSRIIPTDKLSKLRHIVKSDIERLRLKQTFFNCEYWFINNDFKLIEVNGRTAAVFGWIYRSSYNFDLTDNILRFLLGYDLIYNSNANSISAECNLVTKRQGQASVIMDYHEFNRLSYYKKIVTPPDREIKNISDYGTVLAKVYLNSKSYEEIESRLDEIRHHIMRG